MVKHSCAAVRLEGFWSDQFGIIPNSHFSLPIRDSQIIPALTEINGQNFSMTMQDTRSSGMDIPDSHSLIQ